MRSLGLAAATALMCASCAPALMKLPSGAGTPSPDPDPFNQATAACRATSTFTAEIGLAGSVAGRGLRGRLLAGMAAPGSARLEAIAPFGQPVFIFVARNDEATLLLPRDDRVLEHGRPEAVLEAIAAVPLDAPALREALTGCANGLEPGTARELGADWRVLTDTARDVYLHRESPGSPWRLVAAIHRQPGRPTWRAEYRDFQNGPSQSLPRSIRLKTVDAARFDLRLTLSQVEINTPLGSEVFEVRVPSSARPITLEELRSSGPLGSK
jgi:hypothetical protein